MSTLPAKPLSLMLIAGEPSGDLLGGQLMAALRAVAGDSVHIFGMGGPAMTAQGLTSLFPLKDTAVMGLREVVPKIPVILRRVRDISGVAMTRRPDAVVLIDSPDFNHRIARRLKRLAPEIPTINYVAPQVWASRQYRARAMARDFDLLLALLPFEPPFFEKYGLHTVFVGHPVIERAKLMTGGPELRARLGIAPDAPVLCVLPGSRTSEIRFILPVFRDAVAEIAKRVPGLITLLPTVPHVARARPRRDGRLAGAAARHRRRCRQIRRVQGRERRARSVGHRHHGARARPHADGGGVSRRRADLHAGAGAVPLQIFRAGEPLARPHGGAGIAPAQGDTHRAGRCRHAAPDRQNGRRASDRRSERSREASRRRQRTAIAPRRARDRGFRAGEGSLPLRQGNVSRWPLPV